ncbi:hypothetical protein BC937DRAFT_91668 [Endogone sp. FLAS-F59071]|nr:hypothetical protein BC937DRAFT_91668 [Endogone sp. FLAS-F59071]|eukprot:RUS16044.1 hypothetical protein BC937DRAFT_91668 [Endogone sp. FLAS-F59071]
MHVFNSNNTPIRQRPKVEHRFNDTSCFHTTPDNILIDRDVVGSEETVELVKEAAKACMVEFV